MSYDVVIVGGGPAGLSAALALGRARKRVLLCDAGPRRNAAATHMQNFVTRDGTPPAEFRALARKELGAYPNVEVRDVGVEQVTGERGAFEVRLSSGQVAARRILLATGMVDELPALEGLGPLWGHSVFICPYCHGWEVRDRRFGYLAADAEALAFAIFLRGWANDVVAFTQGRFAVPDEMQARLAAAGVRVEPRPIARLVPDGDHLARVELTDGESVAREVLFLHPKQRQVALVTSLGLALDDKGFVKVDELRQTSTPGIYAGGDLTTGAQAAILAAAAGMSAAGGLNHGLNLELAAAGLLTPA